MGVVCVVVMTSGAVPMFWKTEERKLCRDWAKISDHCFWK
jgi:hypothetical protein